MAGIMNVSADKIIHVASNCKRDFSLPYHVYQVSNTEMYILVQILHKFTVYVTNSSKHHPGCLWNSFFFSQKLNFNLFQVMKNGFGWDSTLMNSLILR